MPKKTAAPKAETDSYHVVFAYGDLHLETVSLKYRAMLLDIISNIHPDIIIDMGDIIDADCLSEFPKYPDQTADLQASLDLAKAWMQDVNTIAPQAEKYMLKDNHFIGRLENKVKGSHWLYQLNALNPEELLGMDQNGWHLVNEYRWRGTLIFIHGDEGRKSFGSGSVKCPTNKARDQVKNSGFSLVRGHTHVSGFEIIRLQGRDTVAIQLGTSQDRDRADYLKHPELNSWTNSAGIFYLPVVGTDFLVAPVLFLNGKTVVNGQMYQ